MSTHHPCFSGNLGCSAVNPCPGCKRVLFERVYAKAAVAAGLNGTAVVDIQKMAYALRQHGVEPTQPPLSVSGELLQLQPAVQVQTFWQAIEASFQELHQAMQTELLGTFQVTDVGVVPPTVVAPITRRYGVPVQAPPVAPPNYGYAQPQQPPGYPQGAVYATPPGMVPPGMVPQPQVPVNAPAMAAPQPQAAALPNMHDPAVVAAMFPGMAAPQAPAAAPPQPQSFVAPPGQQQFSVQMGAGGAGGTAQPSQPLQPSQPSQSNAPSPPEGQPRARARPITAADVAAAGIPAAPSTKDVAEDPTTTNGIAPTTPQS